MCRVQSATLLCFSVFLKRKKYQKTTNPSFKNCKMSSVLINFSLTKKGTELAPLEYHLGKWCPFGYITGSFHVSKEKGVPKIKYLVLKITKYLQF